MSQFFIVNGAGPVASTVVGHLKTCLIVSLGWVVNGRSVSDRSILGILVALGGIIACVDIGCQGTSGLAAMTVFPKLVRG